MQRRQFERRHIAELSKRSRRADDHRCQKNADPKSQEPNGHFHPRLNGSRGGCSFTPSRGVGTVLFFGTRDASRPIGSFCRQRLASRPTHSAHSSLIEKLRRVLIQTAVHTGIVHLLPINKWSGYSAISAESRVLSKTDSFLGRPPREHVNHDVQRVRSRRHTNCRTCPVCIP